jgi:O-antigen ligase
MAYQVGRNSGGRVQGIGTVDAPDANGTAAAICPAIVLAVFYFWKSKSKLQRAAFVIALAFIVNAIILINSRGAFLGVAVSMLYFFGFMIFSKFQQENQRRIVAYLLCLAAIGGTVLIDEAFVERMLTIKETEVSYEKETGASRTIFWLAAIDMAKDYPFGQGYRGFNHHSPDYLPPDMDTGSSRNRTVHSTWFEALSEIGYPGLVCFMLLLASCFRTAKQIKHLAFKERNHELYFKLVAMEAALLAFIVAMTFLNRLRAEILHWLILFTAVAYNLYVAQTRQQQHNR